MMDHSQDILNANQTEEVLLEWHMPDRQQVWCAVSYFLYFIAYIPVVIASLPILDGYWRIAALTGALAFAQLLSALVIRPFTLATAQLRCIRSGVFVDRGFRDAVCTPWPKVAYLKRALLGRTVLGFRGLFGGSVYLRVPDDVLQSLITMLREHSSARIVGFD